MKSQNNVQSDLHDKKCQCAGKCKDCQCKKESKTRATKRIPTVITTVFLWAMLMQSLFAADPNSASKSTASGKPGLLIIAHGAPWEQWNKTVLNLESDVAGLLGRENPFCKIKVVFMEFAKPSVADGVKEMEDAGCSRIVAVPLLIAPSSHSHWDIPALLGLYSDAAMEKALKEEGAGIIRSRLPITITGTIAESDIIEKILLKRVLALSKKADEEAVVLLAHGDSTLSSIWEKLMRKTTTYLCGQAGISYGDWVCTEMGQDYGHAASAIRQAAQNRKRVIVVGAYLSMGVDKMHNRWMKQMRSMKTAETPTENVFGDVEVVLAKEGLLPDKSVAKWIADVAKDEIARNSQLLR